MFNISKLGANFNVQNKTGIQKINPFAKTECDTVSFKGKPEQKQQYGTDAILEAIRKCSELITQGKEKIVTEAIALMQAGKVNEAMEQINNASTANGTLQDTPEGAKITAKNWDGSPAEHIFKKVEGFQNLGLIKEVDEAKIAELFTKAFGAQPKTTIGMVGWTNIKPENVQGGCELTKAELTQKYEEAIEEFYSPIDKYFIEVLGIKPSDRALVSSVSYSGVDKALMDLGQKKGINTMTVTPFDYSIYGREEHPFPTIITDTIPQYVDVYGNLADNIIVTGGRDHAFKYDAGNKWLKQNNGVLIPVDVLKDFKGIVVPATINGKIENAAAAAFETFTDPMPAHLIDRFDELPADALKELLKHPAQKALAVAMWDDLLRNGYKYQQKES